MLCRLHLLVMWQRRHPPVLLLLLLLKLLLLLMMLMLMLRGLIERPVHFCFIGCWCGGDWALIIAI